MARQKKQPNTNGTGPAELTDQQRACIQTLADGVRIEAAAGTVGVDPSVVSAWLRDPSFLAAYNAAQRDIHDSGVRQLRKLQDKALGVLEDALGGDDPKLAANVALQLVRINVAMGQPAGETEPEAIEIEQGQIRRDRVFASMTW